jgi:hypothetical protein
VKANGNPVYLQTVTLHSIENRALLEKQWIYRFHETIENQWANRNMFVCLIDWLIGFYATPPQYRSYDDVQALLVEEDLRCPSVHYFRYERAPEYNHRRSVS